MDIDQLYAKMFANMPKPKTAREEYEEYDIKPELDAIAKNPNRSDFLQAKLNLLMYVEYCVQGDPIDGDVLPSQEMKERVRKAGELLHQEGGLESMHSGGIWAWIPKRYHSDISGLWHKIGDWRY